MKKSIVLLACAVILLLTACAGGVDTTKWEDPGYMTMPSDWEGYMDWTMVNTEPITGDESGFLGPAHAGADGYRMIYINDVGKKTSMGKMAYPYPLGTIVVKDAFTDKEMMNLGATTIMVKRDPTYDPANNNWEYIMITPTGEIPVQGKKDSCIGCHANAMDMDYIFTSM